MNEALYIVLAFINLSAVLFMFRMGKSFLYTVIAVNLLFVGLFGAKLVTLAGWMTNVGNVFFAAVFLATHLLVEHYGKRDAQRSIWISYIFQVLLLVNVDLVVKLAGIPQSEIANNALLTLFTEVPRIVLASFAAYICSLYTTISVYDTIRTATQGRMLWLRDTVANIVGQGVDSVLFFTIAFYGTVTSDMLYELITAGFAVKVLIGVLGTPLLYLSYALKPTVSGSA
jgi:uncharacterized integral membrane protein (TIGR00697 family)